MVEPIFSSTGPISSMPMKKCAVSSCRLSRIVTPSAASSSEQDRAGHRGQPLVALRAARSSRRRPAGAVARSARSTRCRRPLVAARPGDRRRAGRPAAGSRGPPVGTRRSAFRPPAAAPASGTAGPPAGPARPARAARRGSAMIGYPHSSSPISSGSRSAQRPCPVQAIGLTARRRFTARPPVRRAAGPAARPPAALLAVPWRTGTTGRDTCDFTSAAKAASADLASRTAPSGCRQAPRPRTVASRRSSRSSTAPFGRPLASCAKSSAIAGSPKTHGPHCWAPWPASQARTRAVSASPQAPGGRTTSTPAPGEAPAARSPARPSAGRPRPRCRARCRSSRRSARAGVRRTRRSSRARRRPACRPRSRRRRAPSTAPDDGGQHRPRRVGEPGLPEPGRARTARSARRGRASRRCRSASGAARRPSRTAAAARRSAWPRRRSASARARSPRWRRSGAAAPCTSIRTGSRPARSRSATASRTMRRSATPCSAAGRGGRRPAPIARRGQHGAVQHQVRRAGQQRLVLLAGRLALHAVGDDDGRAAPGGHRRASSPRSGSRRRRGRSARPGSPRRSALPCRPVPCCGSGPYRSRCSRERRPAGRESCQPTVSLLDRPSWSARCGRIGAATPPCRVILTPRSRPAG